MNIYPALRTIAAAAVLAVTVVGVSAQHADARPRRQPTVAEEACAIPGSAVHSSNDWDFYARGDVILVRGRLYICGAGGQWHPY